jgi:hypothetical protein
MPTIFEQCVASLQDVLAFYRSQGACPCAFPRYRQLASYHFRPYTNTPVGCHVSQLAIGQLVRDGGPFQKTADHGPMRVYTCGDCGSSAQTLWEEFSISMDLTTMEWTELKTPQRGADPLAKIPIPRGFYGLGGAATIQQVADAFSTEATLEEMRTYLKDLRA